MERIEHASCRLGEAYTTVVHPSGLSVYVYPKKMTGIYALFATNYGSLDSTFSVDGKDETLPDGIAHFLEHKLFENEDGTDAFSAFSSLGADANAYTSYGRTAYLFSCTEHFGEALEELLRFVTHPCFRKESVKREASIIAEEIRMYRDQPWERVYESMLGALYRRHPVRKSICGSVASVKRITPEELYRAYEVFYRLSNMALIVCGDVSTEEVLTVVDRILTHKTADAPSVTRKIPRDAGAVAKPYTEERMQVSKPIFSIGIKDAVLLSDPRERLSRELSMSLLNEILFSQASDFYNGLFEKGLLTPAFTVGYSAAETFAFDCLSGESEDPEAVLRELKAYLAEVCKRGISREDFERCRRALYADEIRAYDSTEEIANRLLSFVFDGMEMFDSVELLEEITPEEIEQLMRSFFREDRFVLSVIRPKINEET
ncbi:MAG: insulinase family protein [Ruminococcaceae bacterium]|nr:insulinase family protein [Oscillospiraceae bacterium]